MATKAVVFMLIIFASLPMFRLHPGSTAKVVTSLVTGRTVIASWYGARFHGKIMASGRPFNMHALTVAHRYLSLGTRLMLINPRNGRRALVRVTDRGPYVRGRQLDVSYAVACRLGFVDRGVTRLKMKVVG